MISQELYRRRKAEVGDPLHGEDGEETEDEDLIGYDAIEPGLPPASSDRQKWWLDNKQPARAQVAIPSGRDGVPMTLNPSRPSNPFGHSEEHDWISVSRSSSRASFTSFSSSPYEKVMLPKIMNSMALSTTPRIPPGSEPGSLASRVGRLGMSGDHESLSGSPPLPLPRRQNGQQLGASTAADATAAPRLGIPRSTTMPHSTYGGASHHTQPSTSPGSVKLPPPPVARKPAHLATGLLSRSSVDTASNGSSNGSKPPLPARAATTSGPASSKNTQMPGDKRGLSGMARSGQAFTPSGSQQPSAQPQAGPLDLLDGLDDGGQDMGGWETLQPSTRR